MKSKTIRKILKHKISSLADYVEGFTIPSKRNDELESAGFKIMGAPKREPWPELIYPDKDLPKDIMEGTIVTGGCIVSMLMKENPNDYDFYFRTRDLAFRVSKFFLWLFEHQTGNSVETFIVYRNEGDDVLMKEEAFRETLPKKEDDPNLLEGYLGWNGWRRHYPLASNAGQTPGADRFKIVIKSAGIASTQQEGENYAYFETRQDAEGMDYVDALTATDDVEAAGLEQGIDKLGKHHPKFMSANAITLAGKIQLITRFYGEPQDIHDNYDFVHCTCSYTSWDGVLMLPQEALEAILTKELRYVGSLYPLCSIIRLRKFIARGWHVNAGQILKMIFQVADLDLRNLEVLEDQLVGVDAAYFMQIIDRMGEHQEKRIVAEMEKTQCGRFEAEKNVGGLDSTYLITIIDRIF